MRSAEEARPACPAELFGRDRDLRVERYERPAPGPARPGATFADATRAGATFPGALSGTALPDMGPRMSTNHGRFGRRCPTSICQTLGWTIMSPDQQRRFITCGEALIDLVRDHRAPLDTFVTTWQALSAGGPMNTAVALATMGADSRFLGRISTDEFGQQLRGHVREAGVGLDLITTSDLVTSLAVVNLNDSGKATYAFHLDQTANFCWQPHELPELAAADWLHIGSLAIVIPPGSHVLLDWARQTHAPVSIDLNVRPSVIDDPVDYWSRLEPWLEVVGRDGILRASDDDIEFLAPAIGLRQDAQSWRRVAEQWLTEYDLGLVVITRGPDGAGALSSGDGWVDVPGDTVKVVDTVGAGDTFMAAFLDGWVRLGRDLADALARGVAAASIVCGRQGAQPPTTAEIDERVGLPPSQERAE